MFVISAFGGNDEQLSEAGIQLKYASGVAGHNTRRSREMTRATPLDLMIEFSLASENVIINSAVLAASFPSSVKLHLRVEFARQNEAQMLEIVRNASCHRFFCFITITGTGN